MSEDRFTGIFIAALVTAAAIYFAGTVAVDVWLINSGALR